MRLWARMARMSHRHAFLGIDSVVEIKSGPPVAVISKPQVPFRANRLFVEEACRQFALLDLRIGRNSQFVDGTEVSAEAFTRAHAGRLLDRLRASTYHVVAPPRLVIGYGAAPDTTAALSDAQPTRISPELAGEIDRMGEGATCDGAQVGMDVCLLVRNDGPAPTRFRAVLFGEIGAE